MFSTPGTPVNINGRTGGTPGPATTTPRRVEIPNPIKATNPCWARLVSFTNLDPTNDLRVYINDPARGYRTVKPNTTLTVEAIINVFWTEASASTVQWEATATTAA